MRLIHLAAVTMLTATSAVSSGLYAQAPQPTAREALKTGSEWVSGVAEPASGRFMVYADEHSIKIYNRQTQKTSSVAVTVTNSLGTSLSISRSGQRLVFPSDDDAKRVTYIWSMDLDTLTGAPLGAPHRVSIVSARMASISPDGRWIALMALDKPVPAARGTGNRLIVMPSNGGDERMLDSGQSVRTPRWSPDGKWIFYCWGAELARIAFSGGARDSLGIAQNVIGVSPDGKYVVFNAGRGRQIAEVGGKVVGTVQGFGGNDALYEVSANGSGGVRILAFRQLEPATLKTVSLTDGTITPYAVTERFPVGARFSPDGSRLAMITPINDRKQFVVYDVKTRQRRVLATDDEPGDLLWQWSPNGSHIAFLGISASVNHADLYTIDVVTGRLTRLPGAFSINEGDGRTARNAQLRYRWRSDGQAIDFIGETRSGHAVTDVQRVTLAGVRSVVRALPSMDAGGETTFRFASDSLLLAATDSHAADTGLVAIPLPSGEPRTLYRPQRFGTFGVPPRASPVSPDGKWVAFATATNETHKPQWTIASADGTTSRLLGSVMPCDAWVEQWLPDSRAFIGVGASTCDPWNPEVFVVPIDGGPARHIAIPPNQGEVSGTGYQLTPDGKSILVAIDDPKSGSILSLDLTNLVGGGRTSSPGKP